MALYLSLPNEQIIFLCLLSSSLARALQPSILMQMKLSDGTAQRFEVLYIPLFKRAPADLLPFSTKVLSVSLWFESVPDGQTSRK